MWRCAFAIGTAGLVAAVMGCSNVQKGAGLGAATGAAGGAAVGHYLTSAGGGAGALVGLGVGAAGGALAAERYYGGDESEEIEAARAMAEEYKDEAAGNVQQIAAIQDELAKEKAQQAALLAALDEARAALAKPQPLDGTASVAVDSDSSTLTVTFQSEVFFDSGKAKLSKSGKAALRDAVRTICQRFPDAQVDVRGHTDNAPIRYSAFRSNWDLSCARAVEVVHFLVESKSFRPEQLTATGFGETRPVADNSTAAGRAKNRRVELLVRPGRRAG